MKSSVTRLVVDNREIEAEEGVTLLQACLDQGIYIPNLCYLKGMEEPHASCRLCFVELEGDPRPCAVLHGHGKGRDGRENRHADRPGASEDRAQAPPLGPQGGLCPLPGQQEGANSRGSAKFLGVGLKPKGLPQYLKEPDLVQEHPAIDYYPNRCVLCGRCVRTCRTPDGLAVMTFARRGFDTVISFYGSGERAEVLVR